MNTHATGAMVFIIEDEAAVSRLVATALNEFGLATEEFRSGSSALRRLRQRPPDLCIVDLGLPDMDGTELLRQIGTVSTCGVLVLTGRGHTVDRVMGLELGADDYVVKPFDARELVARVKSILRRRTLAGGAAPGMHLRHAKFSGWTFDVAANVLQRPDGSEDVLGIAEGQVLRVFVERPNQILTREQLVGHHDLSPLDRSIDVRISRLRRRLEQDPQNPKLIKTVYGAGYLFSALVHWT